MSKLLKGSTDEQRAIIKHKDGAAFVTASPGSGKSYCVTKRIAYLLEQGVDPRQIVGITFTNKAANVMKERVARLVDKRLARLVTLSTFHSFCVRLLRSTGQYGVARNFTIADENVSKDYIKMAIAYVTDRGKSKTASDEEATAKDITAENIGNVKSWISDWKNKLMLPDDIAALPRGDVPYRKYLPIYRYYDQRMRRDNVLDFDDLILRVVLGLKKHDELHRFYNEALHYLMVDEWQDTNYAQFELVRLLGGIRKNVLVVGDDDQCLPGDTKIITRHGVFPISELHFFKDVEVLCGVGQKTCAYKPIDHIAQRHYDGELVIVKTKKHHTLRATPEHHVFVVLKEPLPKSLGMEFTEHTYVEVPIGVLQPGMFVPAFNRLDTQVNDDVVAEVTREHYRGLVYDLSVPEFHNYVADGVVVHNSIYGWRGAELENSHRFYRVFDPVTTYKLQTNFRSVPGITAIANNVIKYNVRKHEKEIIPYKTGGEKPTCHELRNTEEEARYILGTIRDMVRSKRASWSDFAIIYRMRSQSRVLEDEAVLRSIPYRVVGALGFYQRKVVQDILAYARLLANPREDTAFTRIYKSPVRGIGTANFGAFATTTEEANVHYLKGLGQRLYEQTAKGAALAGFQTLRRIFVQLRRMEQDGAGRIIARIIKLTHYREDLERRVHDPIKRENALSDLSELVAAARQFDEQAGRHKGLVSFLEHVQLMQQEASANETDVVLLMTAHAAKGREFRCVFVPGLVDGVMPLRPRASDPESPAVDRRAFYEEERRVFYVAITRAEERLWLTWPNVRRRPGGEPERCDPSPFLAECGIGVSRRVAMPAETLKVTHWSRYPSSEEVIAGKRPAPTKNVGHLPDGGVNTVIDSMAKRDEETLHEERLRRRAVRQPVTGKREFLQRTEELDKSSDVYEDEFEE